MYVCIFTYQTIYKEKALSLNQKKKKKKRERERARERERGDTYAHE